MSISRLCPSSQWHFASTAVWTQMIWRLLMLLSMVAIVCGDEPKCYDFGCVFSNYPYFSLTRPSIPAQSPESINTQFLLLTVNNTDSYQVISARNLSSIRHSNFNCSRDTVFIVHGYIETGRDAWLLTMCQSLLAVVNINCICVDWSGGSSAIYLQAINNVQVAGGEIGYFINIIKDNFNCSLSRMILIGHSLGGLVVAEAGKRRPRIAVIIVLDPARPLFQGQPKEVTIDAGDANFVMAVHTDTGTVGLGIQTLVGHVDFFPNGGKQMPGCDGSQILDFDLTKGLLIATRDAVLCNHVFSYKVSIAAILNPDGFMGYCADDEDSFKKGAGFPCQNDTCSLMSYFNKRRNTTSCRKYYLITGPRGDYARWRYNATVQTQGNAVTLGSIQVTLYNSSNVSHEHTIYTGTVAGGATYSAFIDVRFPPPIARITVTLPLLSSLLNQNLSVNLMVLIFGNTGSQYNFCGNETTKYGGTQTLRPCK
ncbi:pancreatic triacylglycerol lipase-like isoform X3 [Engystomops pustulosus]|uniref:pancreatic triacylglycerol lipase-like isoform X3 n=1 Tax=Engystomops pustulosus TaxID=76066 RepID=UPI003AFA8A4F